MTLNDLEEAQCPGMGDLGASFTDSLIKAVVSAPQSQQDVHQLAQATQYAQTPQFQQQIQEVKSDAEMYLAAQMGFQMVATIATFGIFLMMLNKFLKERSST